MATLNSTLIPIEITPGVQPDTDRTNLSTPHYTMSDKVRFWRGIPQKIGGWMKFIFLNSALVQGVPRTNYSAVINNIATTIIGTNSYLYALFGQYLTNITPLDTATTVIANSIATDYGTLANNPISTVSGSNSLTVADTHAALYQIGDSYTLSGATAFNNITIGDMNVVHTIRSIGTNTVTFLVTSTANATGSGGGAAVVRSTGLLTFTANAHGQTNGQRTKIANAAVSTASSATVASAGTNYAVGDILTPVGGTGTAPTFNVATLKAISATPATIQSGNGSYASADTVTVVGGTGTASVFTVATTQLASATVTVSQSGAGSYAPRDIMSLATGTGTAATLSVATTKVVAATIFNGGSGGTNGTQTVSGTTGTGTFFQASVTVAGGVITAVLSIALGGSYTANPSVIAQEPVTGAGLVGAVLTLVMGVNTVTVLTGGSYTANPTSPGATSSGVGTGCTLTPIMGIATLTISSGGSYTSPPTFPAATTTSGSGTGATVTFIAGVNTVTVLTAGAYVTSPANPAATTTNSFAGSGAFLTVTYGGTTTVGGIAGSLINIEYLIRNVTTNTFAGMTTGTATSSVTAAGGALTTYQKQIAIGNINQAFGVGYGVGLYGVGLYGVSAISNSGIIYPRIWFADRFGDRIIMTPGNQSGVYIWGGDTSAAPALIAGAPTDVNYAFVSDNILVTFGHQNVSNQIFSSDQGNAAQWVASSTNQVFQDVVEGADRLVSHVPVLGLNLIFTPTRVYKFAYIGTPNIWSIKLLDNSNGIIAPMARCSVNNVAYWMGQNNFYRWSGGNVETIPANTQHQCTFLKYVFGNINTSQASKAFAWYNDLYSEIWFHYPSGSSNECDRVARVSVDDNVWSPDTLSRSCAEYPDNIYGNPRLIKSDGQFYIHEVGTDDDVTALAFSLESNLIPSGKGTGTVVGFVPDSVQAGDINVNVISTLWPQSSDQVFNKNYTISADGTKNDPREDITVGGRFLKYVWSGAELGQSWIMGNWNHLVQKGPQN